jgi:myo-inositol-1(or 4)-monophosphatase
MLAPQLNIAVRAARKAGEIIRRASEDVSALKISTKDTRGARDYVTEVDRASEAALIEVLSKSFPEHSILCEESGLHEGSDPDWQWVIDPLDGTINFIHGIPQYAISMALKHKGRVEHALVYNPVTEEEFVASRGRGAALNGRRIRVTQCKHMEHAVIGTGLAFRRQQPQHMDNYLAMFRELAIGTVGLRRPGAAALDLAWVAAGRYDGFFEFGLSEWDIAAGSLLVTEAGGLVGDLRGGHDFLKHGGIVAGTPKVFKGLLQTIKPHLSETLR